MEAAGWLDSFLNGSPCSWACIPALPSTLGPPAEGRSEAWVRAAPPLPPAPPGAQQPLRFRTCELRYRHSLAPGTSVSMNSPQLGSWLRPTRSPAQTPSQQGGGHGEDRPAENRKKKRERNLPAPQSLHAESHGHLLRGSRLAGGSGGMGCAVWPQASPVPTLPGHLHGPSGSARGRALPVAAVPSPSALAPSPCPSRYTGPQGPFPPSRHQELTGPGPEDGFDDHFQSEPPLGLTPGLRTVNRTRLGVGRSRVGFLSPSLRPCDF